MKTPLILLVDDDEDLCRYTLSALKPLQLQMVSCGNLHEARKILETQEVDLLLVDLELPDGTGLELLKDSKADDKDRVVTLITGKGTIQSAIEAMKAARRGELTTAGTPDRLLKKLNAGD